jgi:hypothetical protein
MSRVEPWWKTLLAGIGLALVWLELLLAWVAFS